MACHFSDIAKSSVIYIDISMSIVKINGPL